MRLVEMMPAFRWRCHACGNSNVETCRVLSESEILAVSEDGLQDNEIWYSHPDLVQCRFCLASFGCDYLGSEDDESFRDGCEEEQ